MRQLSPQTTGQIDSNGINIYFEAFGNPQNPPVLLIMGLAAQCLNWFPYFYEPLIEQGYYVICFDNRDIGLSSWIDHLEWLNHPYSLEDMAKDAVNLLKALKIEKAHLIGASMGGAIAQRIAISDPGYVLSLTSILSWADATPVINILEQLPQPNSTEIPALEVQLNSWRMLAGGTYPFAEELYRELYREGFEIRQGYNPNCFQHHLEALKRSNAQLEKLSTITAPTLMINGTADPLISTESAIANAKQIPGAKLVLLEGVGHEIPSSVCHQVHQEIFELFALV